MRAKRSKQYRKLMQQYGLTFGFREPYQIVVDAQILLDAAQFKMNFVGLLQNTLHGQVKPMITQCSMRHLYAAQPKNDMVIEHAKAFERRRCNHHDLEEPLSTLECLSSIVDPKGTRTNKHRYVVASQDPSVRSHMRTVPGVPILYLKRSVMILEPMNHATEQVKHREDMYKFRDGLKKRESSGRSKRKRADDDDDASDANEEKSRGDIGAEATQRKRRGPKGPNPLSVRKSRKKSEQNKSTSVNTSTDKGTTLREAESTLSEARKPKRRRRHHTSRVTGEVEQHDAEPRQMGNSSATIVSDT